MVYVWGSCCLTVVDLVKDAIADVYRGLSCIPKCLMTTSTIVQGAVLGQAKVVVSDNPPCNQPRQLGTRRSLTLKL